MSTLLRNALHPAPRLAGLAALAMAGWLGLATAQAQPNSASAPVRTGVVMAIGSGARDDNDAVWTRLVQLAGGPGARVAVFTAPASNPDRAAEQIIASLARRGAVGQHIRVGPGITGQDVAQAVRDPAWIAQVDAAQAVYFSGGAQARLIDTLQPAGLSTPLMDAVRALFARGGVVAGESAGAAVMSELIFRDAPDVLAVMKGRLRDGQEVDRGFGFVRHDVVIDQHLLKRGRIGRLLPLMVARGKPLGLGIEEQTAVVVRGDEVEVVGAHGVLVVELDQPAITVGPGPFNLHNGRISLLDHGDRFDLATRQLTPAPDKQAAPRITAAAPAVADDPDEPAPIYPDLLGDNIISGAMARLIDSGRTELFGLAFHPRPARGDLQPALGFEWRLYTTPDTAAWRLPGRPYTLRRIGVDVTPIRLQQPLYKPY